MDQWAAGLEWLVNAAGHELMLFAAVGILLVGLDDLFFDAMWLAKGRPGATPAHFSPGDRQIANGALAIFVPAWSEEAVIATTLRRTLAKWAGEDFRIYIGCYPNDAGTIFAISKIAAHDRRVRLVIGVGAGPTTKADNLNKIWQAMGEDERCEGFRFVGVVLHDAEDEVHAAELTLYRQYLGDYAMVQIPVQPIIPAHAQWIGGHYGDEFAEAHGKELPLRSALHLALPSAGVGCALSRNALGLLALQRDSQPFRSDSLTEDYELGLLIARHGLRTAFVDARCAGGTRIVSRGAFPNKVETAVRQKTRWIAGIALASWDHLGWLAGAPNSRTSERGWLNRWMLWRDRRAPLAAIVILAGYAAVLLGGISVIGANALSWQAPSLSPELRSLIALNMALLGWRLALRGYFTARCYGWRQGLMAFPRAFVANVIAILAARRALMLYWRMLRTGQVVWDKTQHEAPVSAVVEPVRKLADK